MNVLAFDEAIPDSMANTLLHNLGNMSVQEREALILAPYAVHSADSRGRVYPEPEHPYRGPFQRDRDRIVHCSAYRRLSGKTQVFMGDLGDYHRTRLTHTQEVASIARTLARALRLNEDLTEALALAHDLGHPPFGHAGEETLHACLVNFGGFNHNQHGLTLLTELEQRYPEFPGLNVTYEVLDGQRRRVTKDRGTPGTLEAQVVDAADSIAYDTHDVDDALELGLLHLDELLEIPLWKEAALRVKERWNNLEQRQLERAVVHELVNWLVTDLVTHSAAALQAADVQHASEVAEHGPLIRPSREIAEQKRQLEQFLYARVYRHDDVLRMRRQATAQLEAMFEACCRNPDWLPDFYVKRAAQVGLQRATGDWIASLTDHGALRAWHTLCDR